MSSSRNASLLVAVAALGLVAATAVALYAARNKSRNSSSEGQGPTGDAEKQRSAMEKETSAASAAAAAAPLAIAPAPAGFKALVVCAEGGEEATIAARWASASRGAGAAVSVCPPGFLASHAKASTGAYDSIVVEGLEGVSGAVLEEVVKLLKPGGKVNVVFPADNTAAAPGATAAKRTLTFAGFVGVAASPEDARVMIGQRAAWDAGASAPVRVTFRKPAAAAATATVDAPANGRSVNGAAANGGIGGNGVVSVAPAEKKTWKLTLDDDDDEDGGMFAPGIGVGDEEDDLVDEDALLEESAPVKRASEVDADGCATKRRACKDCSCGRAEMEQSESGGVGGAPGPIVSLGDVDDALTSACGNCSKGDAFRCGGCPFLGKPAFEKGQEKLIMLSDLDSQQDD